MDSEPKGNTKQYYIVIEINLELFNLKFQIFALQVFTIGLLVCNFHF